MKDTLGETPLHWAAKRGYEQLVMYLVNNKADLMYFDLTGKKAKDVAKDYGHSAIYNKLNKMEREINEQLMYSR